MKIKRLISASLASVLMAVTIFTAAPIAADAADPLPTAFDNDYASVKTLTLNNQEEQTSKALFNHGKKAPSSNYVKVDSDLTGQTMLGLGGAMTESAAYNISKLSAEKQAEIYEAYYGKSGAQYALTRSTIGSADFSTRSYSYDDTAKADPDLTQFSIAKDYDYIIPAVKRIQKYNPNVKFFAAPWAPPAWMKKSGKRAGGISTAGIGLVNNSVLPQYYQSYANYFVKYIKAYENEGIPVYSLSMQNESQNNPQWECATWTTDAAITFVGTYLGPTLKANNIDTKLVIWDWDKGNDTLHKDGMIGYSTKLLSNPIASQYIDGVAFHWYAGDLWHEISGKPMWSEDFYSLDEIKAKFPNTHLYATEACQEKGTWFGEIEPARRYIHDVINDFEHGAECFIDWNLVLDSEGGPTQGVSNPCHAPIMLDKNNQICYQPSYYVLKMISRAVQPDTVHIQTTSDTKLDKTAVINKDGDISLLLGNTDNKAITVTFQDKDRTLTLTLPANSLTTVTYPKTASCSHVWSSWKRADSDTHARTCIFDESHMETQPHHFGEWISISLPGCTEAGTLTHTCADCSYTESKEVAATGIHTPVTDKAVKETNTSTGLTAGSHCSVCGEILTAQKKLPAISTVTLYLGVNKTYKLTSKKTASWTITSGSKNASLSKGVLTPKAAGTVKVKDSVSKKTVTFIIKKPVLTVSPASANIKKGATLSIKAKVTPKAVVKCTSSNTSVVKVTTAPPADKVSTATIKVKGMKKGTATLTIKANGLNKKVKITVK